MKVKTTCILLFACIITSCSNNQAKKALPKNWLEYSKNEYSIAFPSNWILDTINTYNSNLFLYCPENQADTIFRSNINLIIQEKISDDFTLESAISSTEKEIKKAIKKIYCKNKRRTL